MGSLVSESKTKAIITCKRLPSKINYEMALTINGTKLEVVPSVKLLGLEIDSELSFIPMSRTYVQSCHSESEY